MDEKKVVANIIQIRHKQGFTKRYVSQIIGMNEASYGRIENGEIALAYSHLARIARCFNMSVVDIITYPYEYKMVASEEEPVEAILQIKLRRDTQDQVLKLVFGNNDLEILNKVNNG